MVENMHCPNTLVSISATIGGKRETKGNETGNGMETEPFFLCKTGNETETSNGNETSLYPSFVSENQHL